MCLEHKRHLPKMIIGWGLRACFPGTSDQSPSRRSARFPLSSWVLHVQCRMTANSVQLFF